MLTFNLVSDTETVYSRLENNAVNGALGGFPDSPTTVNKLLDIGWNNLNNVPGTPYAGAPALSDTSTHQKLCQ